MKPLLTRTLTDSASPTQSAKRLLMALTLVFALFLLSPSVSYSATQDCTVNFSNRNALFAIVDQAALTFVVPSTLIDGRVAAWAQIEPRPSSAQTDLNRWQYRENCDASRISVWDQNDGHFHLMFRDPSLKLCLATGKYGRTINGKCVPVDPLSEPRYASSMFSNSWLEILLLKYIGSPNPAGSPGALRPFDLKSIHVGGTTPIQMWFRKVDGSVWGFSNLPAGVNWDVSGSASNIVAIWVSGAPGSQGAFELNGFSIRTH
jgi:hypothetical protein